MITLQGTGVSPGIALGTLCFCARSFPHLHECTFEDNKAEKERFAKAVQKAQNHLDELAAQSEGIAGIQTAQILGIHKMILDDFTFVETVHGYIDNEKQCAQQAVAKTIEEFVARFAAMEDSYFRARAADIEDVGMRVIEALRGQSEEPGQTCPAGIFAGEQFSPSETARFNRSRVSALALQKGHINSHATILARTLGIPTVLGLQDALKPEFNGLFAILDGETGQLIVEPTPEIRAHYEEKKALQERQNESLQELRLQATCTKDGRSLALYVNLGAIEDIPTAFACGAEGVGLFRSEFLFLHRHTLPGEEEQFEAYRTLAEKLEGRPVTIRTLDIGADKPLPTLSLAPEENPALGVRGIRFSLQHPTIFKTQLRAIYRASAFGKVLVMLPMISTVQELREAKALADQTRQELQREGYTFKKDLPLGIMIETPAAALSSAELAKEADFFSIGTNDLTQYTLALDRQNPLFDALHNPPQQAVLQLIEHSCQSAHAAGIPVSLCGELAAEKALTPYFLNLGLHSLSVIAPAVLPLRKHICSL